MQTKRILVVGDSMLDHYWFGDASRLSPEAPVPIVKVEDEEIRLGGAANVSLNVASLGGDVTLLSLIGDDKNGNSLEEKLVRMGVKSALQRQENFKTILKLRIVCRHQQMLRADFEEHPSEEGLGKVISAFEKLLPSHDFIVFSDYGKGCLDHVSTMIQMAHRAGKTVLVDPKGSDFTKYTDANIITPNKSELRQIVGGWTSEEELTDKALDLCKATRLDALLLTRSEEGMSLYPRFGEIFHAEANAKEVCDVSGAGDTVLATLVYMLSIGTDLKTAVQTANRAGGIVVGKLGTSIIRRHELFPEETV